MLQPGQRFDDYQIISLFASGGMGEIYLAEEVSLRRPVAIKVIRPEAIKYPNSEEARKVIQLFQREAIAIARLNHPYILPLYRFGQATVNANPFMYMVTPYCQEKSLMDWMYSHGKTTLSPQEVEPILRQAAEALQFAHNQGIIHLDVKPSNFLVRYHTDEINNLNLQLADFGVAKFTTGTGMSQTIRGSLEFMAPEQWESLSVFASDQYALAIMVYKLLTNRTPFTGSSFQNLWLQHLHTQPLAPSTINPNVPPAIDSVVLRALAKKPEDRYPSIVAFADAFRQALLYNPTKYSPSPTYLTLTLSSEEASRGTICTLVLPSGELLPITISPGVYHGQIISIPERYGLMVIIAIQTPTVSVSPTLPSIPNYSSSPTSYIHNKTSQISAPSLLSASQLFRSKTRLFILAGLIFVLIIGIGTFLYNHYPDIRGTYTGSFQFSTDNQTTQMTLSIIQQNQQRFGGTCTTISPLFGTNTFTLEHSIVDRSGNIQFTLTGTNLSNNLLVRTFIGIAQSGGGWSGTFSDTGGNQGTWSVS